LEAARQIVAAHKQELADELEVLRLREEAAEREEAPAVPGATPEPTDPEVTPETLEAHADWMDVHQGMGQSPWCHAAESLRTEAKRLRGVEAERTEAMEAELDRQQAEQRAAEETAAARTRVLADLKPGVHEVSRPGGHFGAVVVLPDGTMLEHDCQDGGWLDLTYRPSDKAMFTATFEGDLEAVDG
jgi:hypothetical protein